MHTILNYPCLVETGLKTLPLPSVATTFFVLLTMNVTFIFQCFNVKEGGFFIRNWVLIILATLIAQARHNQRPFSDDLRNNPSISIWCPGYDTQHWSTEWYILYPGGRTGGACCTWYIFQYGLTIGRVVLCLILHSNLTWLLLGVKSFVWKRMIATLLTWWLLGSIFLPIHHISFLRIFKIDFCGDSMRWVRHVALCMQTFACARVTVL